MSSQPCVCVVRWIGWPPHPRPSGPPRCHSGLCPCASRASFASSVQHWAAMRGRQGQSHRKQICQRAWPVKRGRDRHCLQQILAAAIQNPLQRQALRNSLRSGGLLSFEVAAKAWRRSARKWARGGQPPATRLQGLPKPSLACQMAESGTERT